MEEHLPHFRQSKDTKKQAGGGSLQPAGKNESRLEAGAGFYGTIRLLLC